MELVLPPLDQDPAPPPPERPQAAGCCGCESCVFDLYEEALARYQLTSRRVVYNVLVMKQVRYAYDRRLDRTFAALANPTRRAILARLASGEVSVNELAEPFEMTQPAISRHLKVLEEAGLISTGSDAQRRPRKLEARPLAEAAEWLVEFRKFWEASFLRLDALLDELQRPARSRRKKIANK